MLILVHLLCLHVSQIIDLKPCVKDEYFKAAWTMRQEKASNMMEKVVSDLLVISFCLLTYPSLTNILQVSQLQCQLQHQLQLQCCVTSTVMDNESH